MTTARGRWWSLASVAVMFAACSGRTTSDPGVACAPYVDAYCSKMHDCTLTIFEASYPDVATCKSRLMLACLAELAAPDAMDIASCAAQLPATNCYDFAAGAMPVPCRRKRFRAGATCKDRIPLGAACGSGCRGADCGSEGCEDGTVCPQGVCATYRNLGEDCTSMLCHPSLRCDPLTLTCVAGPKVGDACCPGPFDVATGSCTGHPDCRNALTPLACVGGFCQASQLSSARCAIDVPCPAGYTCLFGHPAYAGNCVGAGETGAPCAYLQCGPSTAYAHDCYCNAPAECLTSGNAGPPTCTIRGIDCH